MIQNELHLIRTDDIIIDRDTRQRKVLDPKYITTLSEKIHSHGLIHGILLEEGSLRIIAGECRTAAFKLLHENGSFCENLEYENWTRIPARIGTNISQEEILEIEFIENVTRSDFPWIDYAYGIARIHIGRCNIDPNWTQARTADMLGISQSAISKSVEVAESHEQASDKERVAIEASSGLGAAYNILERKKSRANSSLIETLLDPVEQKPKPATSGAEPAPTIFLDPILGHEVEAPKPRDESIILPDSFNDWAKTYEGPPFNFIHCDFPYGVGLDKSMSMNTPTDWNSYEDTEEVYWTLINSLLRNNERLIAPSAHLMFWFSMNHYSETIKNFHYLLQNRDIKIQGFPLVWHKSDNLGIIQDAKRYGRRTYETALVVTFGDRQINKPVAISASFPSKPQGTIHRSEKPTPMLSHFFQLFVDSSTHMLDPTCGSGSSLRAATKLGASSVLGLEIDPAMREQALESYHHETKNNDQ